MAGGAHMKTGDDGAEAPEQVEIFGELQGKNPHAAALSALGASKGGRARARKLSPERRREIARKGAMARWRNPGEIPKATYGSPDRPLRIGDLEIPCYVLEDGRRVLVQRGMMSALDMKQGTAGRGAGDRLAKFVSTKALTEFVSNELRAVITEPIQFQVASGAIAYGYEATVLADLCDVVLAARKSDRLHYQQAHIADRCEILVRAFARTGIIALVDEATGYQDVRARDALAEILERFVAQELRKWVKTFPTEYYKELFRLRGWQFSPLSVKRPALAGKLTNDIVYARLAPGVLEELRRVTPRDERGRLKTHLHRRLTEDLGHPRLREHLAAVIALMRISKTWKDFERSLNIAFPKFDGAPLLPFD
jgi:hypothetical protein